MVDTEAAPKRRPRVVQWATGYVGRHALRKVIEHPGLELVGVRVFAEAKEGRDAGELCGLPPTGIKATRDIEEVIALKPDCVLYMQEGCDYDDVCRLLESGVNIVTTRYEFLYGPTMDPAMRARVEEACRRGHASIHATGSSPGFVTEALPIVLSSIQRRVDAIVIDEFANMVDGCPPAMLFDILGYGRPIASFDAGRLAWLKAERAPSLHLLADALGKPIDSIEAGAEMAGALQPIDVPGPGGGTIQPGTLAAERVTLTAMHGGEPFITFRANWHCGQAIDADWPLRDVGWRVQVAGDAPLDVELRFPIPKERMAETLCGYTAHRPVNAIRAVCEAPPGLVSTLDLPQILGGAGS